MTKLDDAKKRSSVLSARIRQRTDVKLRNLIASFNGALSFPPLDDLMISQAAWDHVASAGIDPKEVFAHPELFCRHPETSEYYRGIALLSRKRVAAMAVSVEAWETGRKSRITIEQGKKLARLYNTVISSIIEGSGDWTLENGYRNIIANMGIGLDGSIRNLIGQDAENMVKDRILQWLDAQGLIEERDDRRTRFKLPNGYSMSYGSEPDIEFRQNAEGEDRVVATIEIKGGTDPAGALERLGAVQKSFEATPANCVNILIAGIVTAEMEQRLKNLGVSRRFLLDDITHDGKDWFDFLNEVFHHVVRIASEITGPRKQEANDS